MGSICSTDQSPPSTRTRRDGARQRGRNHTSRARHSTANPLAAVSLAPPPNATHPSDGVRDFGHAAAAGAVDAYALPHFEPARVADNRLHESLEHQMNSAITSRASLVIAPRESSSPHRRERHEHTMTSNAVPGATPARPPPAPRLTASDDGSEVRLPPARLPSSPDADRLVLVHQWMHEIVPATPSVAAAVTNSDEA
uniref:Uncharacterized protein n=1 Tax=Neobodo designis TaxID=312471 RepID=A0A7S1MQZ7_NEODS